MSLSKVQQTTLAAHINASIDVEVIAALAIGDDIELSRLYNIFSTTEAWRTDVPKDELFEAMSVSKFDTLSQGKRDAWRLVLDIDVLDFEKNKLRKGINDIWDGIATQPETLINVGLEFATIAEEVIGGNIRTTSTTGVTPTDVSGIKRKFIGQLNHADIARVLNENGRV